MADWPHVLPDFRLDGNSAERMSTLTVTEMDAGNREVIRRFPDGTEIYNYSMIVNDQQLQVFEYFFHFIVNDGASWFMAPIRDALGRGNQSIRMPEMYVKEHLDNRLWLVNLTIELMDTRYMDADDYNRIVNPGVLPDWAGGDWDDDDWKTS